MAGYDALTPFVDQGLSRLTDNNAAFGRALGFIPGRPRRVVEAFGGIGSQSRVIRERWPRVQHVAYERDARCFEMLAEVPGVAAVHSDYPVPELGAGVLLVADCNNFTLAPARWADFRAVVETGAEWLVLTDIARGKLHLNFRAYGLDAPDYPSYVAEIGRRTRRSVLGWVAAPKSLSYITLRRGAAL